MCFYFIQISSRLKTFSIKRIHKNSLHTRIHKSSNETSNNCDTPSGFDLWDEKNSQKLQHSTGSQKPTFFVRRTGKNMLQNTMVLSLGFCVVASLLMTPRSAKASPLTSGSTGGVLMNEQTTSNSEDVNSQKLVVVKSAEENIKKFKEHLEKLEELSRTFERYRTNFYHFSDETSKKLFKFIFEEDFTHFSQVKEKFEKPEFETLKKQVISTKLEGLEVLEMLSRKTIYFSRLNARMQQTDHKLCECRQELANIQAVLTETIEKDLLNKNVSLEKFNHIATRLKKLEDVLFSENALHKHFCLFQNKRHYGKNIHERYHFRTLMFLGFNLNGLKDPTKVKQRFEIFPCPVKSLSNKKDNSDTDSPILFHEYDEDRDLPRSPSSQPYVFDSSHPYFNPSTSDDECYSVKNFCCPEIKSLTFSENSSNPPSQEADTMSEENFSASQESHAMSETDLVSVNSTTFDDTQAFFFPLWWKFKNKYKNDFESFSPQQILPSFCKFLEEEESKRNPKFVDFVSPTELGFEKVMDKIVLWCEENDFQKPNLRLGHLYPRDLAFEIPPELDEFLEKKFLESSVFLDFLHFDMKLHTRILQNMEKSFDDNLERFIKKFRKEKYRYFVHFEKIIHPYRIDEVECTQRGWVQTTLSRRTGKNIYTSLEITHILFEVHIILF